MASWAKIAYSRRLFLWLVGYSVLMVACVLFFQYRREKDFKAAELDARLQLVNERILADSGSGSFTVDSLMMAGFDNLRVSIIDPSGRVIYDNSLDALPNTNHLSRKEISRAVMTGSGYTLRRHSESTGETYFYSARRGENGMIVRTAVPYTVSLNALLKADSGFLWFLGGLTLVMCTLGYFATRRAGDEVALHEKQEKERIRKQLTNNINHELKTPVASIRVCLETLLAHPAMSEEKRQEFLSRCFAHSQRLQQLLSDVSLITRMEDGTQSIARERIDLAEVIRDVVEEQNMTAGKNGFTILNTVTGPLEIHGNRALMESVFSNLISNAISYSGGNTVTISREQAQDDKIILTVSDNGTGVAEEHLPRLFERFYRVDKGRSRAAGGTGLGLSIVKNAVQLHGGSISVSNQPQGGLCFRIVLK